MNPGGLTPKATLLTVMLPHEEKERLKIREHPFSTLNFRNSKSFRKFYNIAI